MDQCFLRFCAGLFQGNESSMHQMSSRVGSEGKLRREQRGAKGNKRTRTRTRKSSRSTQNIQQQGFAGGHPPNY